MGKSSTHCGKKFKKQWGKVQISPYSDPDQQFAEETPADDQCEEMFDNEHSEGDFSLRTDLDVKSCKWKFSGDYQLTSSLSYRLQTIKMHFREEHLLKTPVIVDHLHE